jgi:hypothetical protein
MRKPNCGVGPYAVPAPDTPVAGQQPMRQAGFANNAPCSGVAHAFAIVVQVRSPKPLITDGRRHTDAARKLRSLGCALLSMRGTGNGGWRRRVGPHSSVDLPSTPQTQQTMTTIQRKDRRHTLSAAHGLAKGRVLRHAQVAAESVGGKLQRAVRQAAIRSSSRLGTQPRITTPSASRTKTTWLEIGTAMVCAPLAGAAT